ncbi:MAG: 50S ribosomal protein L17 [Myxococcales bacterium]|nr:50S ribosomal protein L17 [Myxococcales bacterium]
MRHKKAFRKFSRTSAHRRAMFANMAMALVENGRIRTTEAKAKDLRRVVEKLVTLGLEGTLDARRRAIGELGGSGKSVARQGQVSTRNAVQKLFGELAERFRDRPGGYTRVIKLGPRRGDNAPMAVIEFVDYLQVEGVETADADDVHAEN